MMNHSRSNLSYLALVGVSIAALDVARAQDAKPDPLQLRWKDNILTISSPRLPGDKVEIWYLEAFCRSGSTHREWRQTVIPHKTTLLDADADGRHLRLESVVEPGVRVRHEIRSGPDEVDFRLTIHNPTDRHVDIDWFQPCMRVGAFTGLGQDEYHRRCFLFTDAEPTMLDRTRRTEEAIYRGGQVYVPAGVDRNDVNPRPLSPDIPVNGLIGCVSADGKLLLATAWSDTQELFQGVIVCIHNDPRIGGLDPGQTKRLQGKVYLMKNDKRELLARYQRDFSSSSE